MIQIFKNKVKKLRSPNARNSLISGMGSAISALSLLLVTPLLLVKLGKEAMGTIALCGTVLGLSGVATFGMGQATIKYVSKYRALCRLDRINAIVSTTLTFYFLISAILGLLAFLGAGIFVDYVFRIPPELKEEALLAFRLTALGMVFTLCNDVAASSLKGFERFDLAVGIDVIVRLLTVGLQIALLLAGHGLVSMVVVIVCCQGAGMLIRLAALNWKAFPDLKLSLGIDREAFSETFGFGLHTWVASLVYRLRADAPALLLGSFVGPGAVAIYRIADRILSQFAGILASMTQYLFPLVSKQFELKNTEKLHQQYTITTQNFVVLSAMAMAPLAVCAKPFISVWISSEIALEVAPILVILALRHALIPLANINFAYIAATNNQKGLVRLQLLASALIIPASCIGVSSGGLIGLAWAQLTVFLTLVINRAYIERKLFGSAVIKTQLLLILALTSPIGGLAYFTALPVSAGWLSMVAWALGSSFLAGLMSWLIMVAIPRGFGGIQNKADGGVTVV